MEILRDKFNFAFLFFLSIIGSEVLIMLNIDVISFVTPIINNLLQKIVGAGSWVYGYVGIVVFPLFALSLLYSWATFRLAQIYLGGSYSILPDRLYKGLEIVETTAPIFGFLGTTLSLLSVMSGIDPKLEQSQMLKILMNNSASAFGSTVYGLVNSVAAYLTRKAFENFLLPAEERRDENEYKKIPVK